MKRPYTSGSGEAGEELHRSCDALSLAVLMRVVNAMQSALPFRALLVIGEILLDTFTKVPG
jgi:hypothetical protein